MPEPKTTCIKCNAEILVATAARTQGLCMPCKTGWPRRPAPNEVEVSCSVHSDVEPDPVLFAAAPDLLQELEKTRGIGDSTHANRFELEAQRALVRHALRYRINFRLNDDHWGCTGSVLLRLFEQGKATMQVDQRRFQFSELKKEDWSVVHGRRARCGGFLYRDSTGNVVYKLGTWIS